MIKPSKAKRRVIQEGGERKGKVSRSDQLGGKKRVNERLNLVFACGGALPSMRLRWTYLYCNLCHSCGSLNILPTTTTSRNIFSPTVVHVFVSFGSSKPNATSTSRCAHTSVQPSKNFRTFLLTLAICW